MKHRLLATALLVATAAPLVPAVAAPAASAACTVTVRLSPGTTNAAVQCLEQRLIDLGYATRGYAIGTPDSFYGSETARAVRYFQSARGLYNDGVVTSITGRQLGLRGVLAPAGSPKISVLGDSTSAAMRWYDEARNETAIYDVMGTSYDLVWSVESCKRLMAASCVGRTDPGTGHKYVPRSVLPEMQTTLRGRLGDAVVVMAGYDDYPSIADDIDAIVNEAEAQGVSRVFWLTYRTTSGYAYGSYYLSHNAALSAARAKHPNLVVLDWNGYTHRQSAATQDAWFESDNIHMTRAGGMALANFLKANIDASQVRRCTVAKATAGSAPSGSALAAPDPTETRFSPSAPVRLLDTASTGIKVGAGRVVRLDLSSLVPPSATSAALTLAAVEPCRKGSLVAYASTGATCGAPPSTTSLQFEAGRTSSSLTIASLASRTLCVYTSAATDIAVFFSGHFAADAPDLLHTVPSTRWADTRGNTAKLSVPGPVPAGGSRSLQIAGVSPVPAGATAVLVNVTLVTPAATTRALVYPGNCSTFPPNTFTVAAFAGRTTAATGIVRLGGDGTACLRMSSAGGAHVVIDVLGWFGPDATGGRTYRAQAPTTVVDQSVGSSSTVAVPGSTNRTQVLNVSVTNGAGGNVVLRPCAAGALALLYPAAREPVVNTGVVTPAANSGTCISSAVAATVRVDVTGQFDLPA